MPVNVNPLALRALYRNRLWPEGHRSMLTSYKDSLYKKQDS